MNPRQRITDPGFVYVPSHETDLAATFARVRAKLEKEQAQIDRIDEINARWDKHVAETKPARDALRAQFIADGVLPPDPPYPEFCRHPEQCAGLSYCPRDPTCID